MTGRRDHKYWYRYIKTGGNNKRRFFTFFTSERGFAKDFATWPDSPSSQPILRPPFANAPSQVFRDVRRSYGMWVRKIHSIVWEKDSRDVGGKDMKMRSTRVEALSFRAIKNLAPQKRRLSRLHSDNRLFGVPSGKMSDR